MINRLINLVLDLLIVVMLGFLIPVWTVLFLPAAPVYAKIVGVCFTLMIVGAVIFTFRQNRQKITRKEI